MVYDLWFMIYGLWFMVERLRLRVWGCQEAELVHLRESQPGLFLFLFFWFRV